MPPYDNKGLTALLLAEMGVTVCGGAAIHKDGADQFPLDDFHRRYDRAFEDVGESRVVVAIAGRWGSDLYVVDSVKNLWENRSRFADDGIKEVVAVPKSLMQKITTKLGSNVHDLKGIIAA